MVNYRRRLGTTGERIAEAYLVARGYRIIDRNIRTPFGEIDLIARNDHCIIFIEVKTRRSLRYGLPEQAITRRKVATLVHCATLYLQSHPDLDGDWQIDVIAIRHTPSLAPEIHHIEDAVHGR